MFNPARFRAESKCPHPGPASTFRLHNPAPTKKPNITFWMIYLRDHKGPHLARVSDWMGGVWKGTIPLLVLARWQVWWEKPPAIITSPMGFSGRFRHFKRLVALPKHQLEAVTLYARHIHLYSTTWNPHLTLECLADYPGANWRYSDSQIVTSRMQSCCMYHHWLWSRRPWQCWSNSNRWQIGRWSNLQLCLLQKTPNEYPIPF
jgi:hypothetical protein